MAGNEYLPTLLLAVLSGLGLLGGIGLGVKALVERRALNATASATRAKAGNDDATAASIVAAAARELIDPLRRELATERAENMVELEREREKVRKLQSELDIACEDASELRTAMHDMLMEMAVLKEKIAAQDRQIIDYEREIARYREARRLNDDGLASGPHEP